MNEQGGGNVPDMKGSAFIDVLSEQHGATLFTLVVG